MRDFTLQEVIEMTYKDQDIFIEPSVPNTYTDEDGSLWENWQDM